MNKKLAGIIGIILSILFLVYFNDIFYKLLIVLNIDINSYSILTKSIIDLIIKLCMCFIIYLIYKKDFKHSRKSNNIFKSILFMLIYLIVLILGVYLFGYIINYLGNLFNVSIIDNVYYNIFNKKIDIYLIIKIINDYVLIPFIYSSLVILSVDKLCRRNDIFILLCGLLGGICYALTLHGTFIYTLLNSLNTFIIYCVLAMAYRKNNSIYFSIILYGLYLVSYGVILNYLGW